MSLHVASILQRAAADVPDRVALIDLGAIEVDARDVGAPGRSPTEWTYRQWDQAARCWAQWLMQSDVRDGDRVALFCGNGLGFAAQWFGAVYANCTVVPIPVMSSVDEVRHRLEHARCRVLVCDEARLEVARAAITNVTRRPILVLDADVVTDGASVFSRTQADSNVHGSNVHSSNVHGSDTNSDEAIAMILYTSGTTGQAKGACISHRALSMHTQVLTERVLELGADDRVLGVLPLTHSYGCRMLLLAVAHARATAVLMPRFDAARSLAVINSQRITWVPAVPTMFAAWSEAVDANPQLRPSTSLRWAMSAGAPIADALVQRAEAALGVEVRQAYGMTEATLSTVNGPSSPRVLGCVGKAVPGVSLRVVNDHGEDVTPGSTGEVWVRGHNAMSAYLDDVEATDTSMTDGWFRSGDVGRINADGNLWIVDRIKDLIIRGGFNIVPAEVEAALAEHPAVAEVAVVGRPDDYYGEEVVAFVVPRAETTLEAEELLAWCESRLSKLKRPRDVVFLERFPLGPSGKILKRELREPRDTRELREPRDRDWSKDGAS